MPHIIINHCIYLLVPLWDSTFGAAAFASSSQHFSSLLQCLQPSHCLHLWLCFNFCIGAGIGVMAVDTVAVSFVISCFNNLLFTVIMVSIFWVDVFVIAAISLLVVVTWSANDGSASTTLVSVKNLLPLCSIHMPWASFWSTYWAHTF